MATAAAAAEAALVNDSQTHTLTCELRYCQCLVRHYLNRVVCARAPLATYPVEAGPGYCR